MRLRNRFRFPPEYVQKLIILFLCIAGILALLAHESWREGLTVRHGLFIALAAALSALAGKLISRERRYRALLRDLRSTITRIAPHPAELAVESDPASAIEGLEHQIRVLKEQWTEFCIQCQHVHDTQMVHAEHLASLGELAAGLAHEIRNPLAGIAGAVDVITKDFPADHPNRKIMEEVRQEARRIEKTLNDSLAYARPKPPKLAPAAENVCSVRCG